MSDYTVVGLDEVPDLFGGKYPGTMRMLTGALGSGQVALTHREMPPGSGGKGGYGHRHKTQEELYFVVSGTLQFKLEDEVIAVPAGTAVRIAPGVARSVWNAGPDDAQLIMCSVRIDDVRADVEMVEDFWPAD
jgi:uncharacterized cupin superfamily protein